MPTRFAGRRAPGRGVGRHRRSDVFRTDVRSLGRIGARWAWDLSFGGALRHVQPKSLLDTAPLRTLLERIPLARIAATWERRAVRAAVAATDLYTANGYLFVQGAGHPAVEAPALAHRAHARPSST